MENTLEKIYFGNGVNVLFDGNKYGLLNDVLDVIVHPIYDEIFSYQDTGLSANPLEKVIGFSGSDYAKVRKGNKYGFIDKYGVEILACKYDEAYMITKKLFNVKVGSFMTIVNPQNKPLFPLFDDIFSRRLNSYGEIVKSYSLDVPCIYRNNGKYGLLDYMSGLLSEAIYDEINVEEFHSTNLYIPVRSGNKWGMLNIYGDVLLSCKYDKVFIGPFSDESADWNKLYHKIKTNQEIDFSDEHIQYLIESFKFNIDDKYGDHEFLAYVLVNGKYGLCSVYDEEIIPCKYDSIDEVSKILHNYEGFHL